MTKARPLSRAAQHWPSRLLCAGVRVTVSRSRSKLVRCLPASDDGYFLDGVSVLRRVHEQRVVGLLYGQRALCVGAMNPLAYIGSTSLARGSLAPFTRLARTGIRFESVFFAGGVGAERALAVARRMHERVGGALGETVGPFSAGTRYSALDPDLMLWTIAVMMDSAETFYRLLIGSLSEHELEQLWREYVSFGVLFGMPETVAAQSYREFRRWFDERLHSKGLHLTPQARHGGHAMAFGIPLPWWLQPAKRLHDAIMPGALPDRARAEYGLRWGLRQRIVARLAIMAVRLTLRVLPSVMRGGPNAAVFELIGRTERQRIERGTPTPRAWGELGGLAGSTSKESGP